MTNEVIQQFVLANCPEAIRITSSDKILFRCLACGDSEKSGVHRHCYLLSGDKGPYVYCHRCGYSASVKKFFKDYFPFQWDMMKEESLKNLQNCRNRKKEIFTDRVKKQQKIEDSEVGKFLNSACYPLFLNSVPNSLSVQEMVNNSETFLKNRRINSGDFYVCFDPKNSHFKRIIIPFRTEENIPYYFQSRTIFDNEKPKYKTMGNSGLSNVIYKEFQVNKNKTVYLCEGILDSLFIKNAVSILGCSISKNQIKLIKSKFPEYIFVLDSDTPSIKTAKRLLRMGEKVIIIDGAKDVNELIIKNNVDYIDEEYLEKNTLVGSLGEIKLSRFSIRNL